MPFAAHRDRYLAWATATFTPEQVRDLSYDEVAYPGWHEIEALFAEHARAGTFSTLAPADVDGLLFLLARSWDLGRMLAWISDGSQLSNLAPLSESDLLFLAAAALDRPGPELDDARSQLAVLLGRVVGLAAPAESLLLRFFETGDEYTSRRAMVALADRGYPDILALVRRAWQVPDEHRHMACLHVIAGLGDQALLEEFVALAESLPGEYLAAFRRTIRLRP